MARKVKETQSPEQEKNLTFSEKKKDLRKIIEGANKAAGGLICGFIDDPGIAEKLTLKFIPTPNDDLNEALGGGFPVGRTSIVTGLSDSGKTSLLLETIGLNMAKDPDFIALWLESEQSLNLEYMLETFHIDPSRFIFVRVPPNEGAEAALDYCEGFLRQKGINMFVINSMRALVPKSELNKSISEDTVGRQATMNTKMLKKYLNLIYENEVAFVMVQHLTTLIGTMGRD